MRDAIILELDGLVLHGTRHIPRQTKDIGVLFFNSGSQPRNSRGDLLAHVGDFLADQGYFCFRVDLPGYGDSQGDLPPDCDTLYSSIEDGAYAEIAVKVLSQIREQFGLGTIIVGGICGGAATALFAAALERRCKVGGLLLLDLPFFFARLRKQATGNASRGPLRTSIKRLSSRLHDWVLEQKWEPYVTKAYRGLKRLRKPSGPNGLPPDTNWRLVGDLRNLLKSGVPALLIFAQPSASTGTAFDYAAYLQMQAGSLLTKAVIEGTTHSFVENDGEVGVLRALSSWLDSLEHQRQAIPNRAGFNERIAHF